MPVHKFRYLLLALICCGCCASFIAAQDQPLSPRNASYTIQVRLDPAQKMLDGREVITWRNDLDVPARELWFHLYWNAWKNNRSTWLREASLRGRRTDSAPQEGDWSYCDLKSVKVMAGGPSPEFDLTSSLRFAAPDDNNPDDQTVAVATLPQPVTPKQTVQVEVVWKSKIPRTFARTGFRGNFFFIAQWFPKLGVYQPDGAWNCHQFHAGTEFFSDFGVYDVNMTVPRGWLLGATGTQQGAVADSPDGTSTHHYLQADVHDFAWTTSPDYREATKVFEHPGLRPVKMRLLYQPEHQGQIERHFKATEATLRNYGLWFGEYPYDHITMIDPAYGSGAGGMEYPTLFTCGTRYFNPEGGGSPEGVTVHEAGHQFWFAIVANNEFEDAWLDEGFNTFSTERAMEAAFGQTSYVQRFFKGFFPVMTSQIKEQRMTEGNGLAGYRSAARSDAESTPSFLYFPGTGGNLSYNKTALWLSTMERTLGWNTLQKILSTYYQRFKFRHPKPDDFFSVANEVSGKNLNDFFDQVYRKAAVFDFEVSSVASDELKTEGFITRDGKATYTSGLESKLYETRVVVRRLQDGILPVDVLLKFENGDEFRDLWDAKNTWKLYTLVKPAKLLYASVDPDRKILLDIDYTNNSKLLVPQPGFAAVKWASKWMFWLQDFIQTLSFFN
jgi:hypothetical protein